jgi:ribonuclease D
LSDRQHAYALDDVRYLLTLREALLDRARDRDRLAWMHEELAAYDDPALYEERDPHTQFMRVSGAGRLSSQKRAVLRELAAWREREARRQDRPRRHVLADKTLAALARRPPRSRKALTAVRGLDDGTARRYGEALLQAVARGLAMPPEDHPRRAERPPQDEALAARVNLGLAFLTGKSLTDGIDPGLVATRADVTALAADGADADRGNHALLQGCQPSYV